MPSRTSASRSPLSVRVALGLVWGLALVGCEPDDECSTLEEVFCRGSEIVRCVENDNHAGGVPWHDIKKVLEVEWDCADEGHQCLELSDREPHCGFADMRCDGPREFCAGTWAAACFEGAEHPAAGRDCSREHEEKFCVTGEEGHAGCSMLAERCDPRVDSTRCEHGMELRCEHGVWVRRYYDTGLLKRC